MPRDNVQENSLTPRHEAFCQYFVLGGNAAYAARDAGYAAGSSKNQGYRLMRRARIRARVAAIRSELAGVYALDARVLLGKLEALYLRAIEGHHFHAGVRAVEAQARIAAAQGAAAQGGYARGGAARGGDAERTTHDDFPASVPDVNKAKSIGCDVSGGLE